MAENIFFFLLGTLIAILITAYQQELLNIRSLGENRWKHARYIYLLALTINAYESKKKNPYYFREIAHRIIIFLVLATNAAILEIAGIRILSLMLLGLANGEVLGIYYLFIKPAYWSDEKLSKIEIQVTKLATEMNIKLPNISNIKIDPLELATSAVNQLTEAREAHEKHTAVLKDGIEARQDYIDLQKIYINELEKRVRKEEEINKLMEDLDHIRAETISMLNTDLEKLNIRLDNIEKG